MLERDIRLALRASLALTHSRESSCAIIEELGLCDSEARIDIAVINGAMHAYEIKSNRDTLKRLPQQQDQYAKCFDTVTVVVGSKHAGIVASVIPDWWGIIETIDKNGTTLLESRREPGINGQVDSTALVKFLWKPELVAVLSSGDVSLQSISKLSRHELRELAVATIPHVTLARHVREQIKARGEWRSGPTPFRSGGSSRSSAKSRHSQANRQWLLSLVSPDPQR
jgi:hypothetical protein